jgi:SAM-dependent methyltransferase
VSTPPDPADHLELNRAMWDERVPIHTSGDFYDVEGFRAGRDPIRPFEDDELGPVAGLDLVHLQCHFGLDTLGWARRGARVTGLDFSAPAIEYATGLAADLGIDARFVTADVHDAPEALGATYDVVYTGLGALIWLPDLRRWAEVVDRLLRPGGVLYLVEFHPITGVFGDDDLTVEWPYFDTARFWDEPGTYADGAAPTEHNASWEWNHTLAETLQAVLERGLVVEWFAEHDYTLFPRWPILHKEGFDTYRLPPERPSLPLMYSLRARQPAG